MNNFFVRRVDNNQQSALFEYFAYISKELETCAIPAEDTGGNRTAMESNTDTKLYRIRTKLDCKPLEYNGRQHW
jgi:hypothetical protein